MKKSIKEGEELMRVLASKAWKSVSFKEQLIVNPKVTIENVTGAKMSIPEGSKIVVEDQTDTNIIYLNIPRKIDVNDLQLTEEQLARVAGGEPITLVMIGIGIGYSLAATAIYDMGGGAYATFQDFF